jgi:hypothetical protein
VLEVFLLLLPVCSYCTYFEFNQNLMTKDDNR